MAQPLPPSPTGSPPGSGFWNDWYEKLRTLVNSIASGFSWTLITDKPTTIAGFGITDGVSTSSTLTSNAVILGAGSHTVSAMGSLGTTTTLLHGNAAGAPTFGAVTLTTDVTGTLPVANGGTGVTSSTGTVAVVLSNTPTLVTPVLGAATGTSINLSSTATVVGLVNSGNITNNASNAGIEHGAKAAANTPFIDFNSSGNSNDYDVRIIASGGTGSVGNGDLTITSATVKPSGQMALQTVGKGISIKEGTNAKMGTAVLVAGAVVVNTTAVTATSRIFLTSNADGGTPGFQRVSARTASTSFTITSSNGADTSTVAWILFEPS